MHSLRTIIDNRSFVGTVLAYGTPEGVAKAWDSRGRGRHPEYDKFKQTSSKEKANGSRVEVHKSPAGHTVRLEQDARKGSGPARFTNTGERSNVPSRIYTPQAHDMGTPAKEGNARITYTPKGGSPQKLAEFTHENSKGDPGGRAQGYMMQRFGASEN